MPDFRMKMLEFEPEARPSPAFPWIAESDGLARRGFWSRRMRSPPRRAAHVVTGRRGLYH